MSYFVYILHSIKIDWFYTGYTHLMIQERLRRHNSNHKGYTGKTDDWKVSFINKVKTKDDALQLEKNQKKRC